MPVRVGPAFFCFPNLARVSLLLTCSLQMLWHTLLRGSSLLRSRLTGAQGANNGPTERQIALDRTALEHRGIVRIQVTWVRCSVKRIAPMHRWHLPWGGMHRGCGQRQRRPGRVGCNRGAPYGDIKWPPRLRAIWSRTRLCPSRVIATCARATVPAAHPRRSVPHASLPSQSSVLSTCTLVRSRWTC